MDIATPALAIGHAFGRIGCFMAGCCYGKTTDLPWGVIFNHPETMAKPLAQALHPTQLYESLAEFMIFFFLLWFRKRHKFRGQMVLTYFLIYDALRFFVEYVRGDRIRGYVIPDIVSTSQFIAILTFLVAIGFYVKRYRDQSTWVVNTPIEPYDQEADKNKKGKKKKKK
jgi:phosphatidylglycerol:prolipoprotein diacylglycerol transferase